MLNVEETKAVLVSIWHLVNATPNVSYPRRAFERLVLSEFNKAAVQKNMK